MSSPRLIGWNGHGQLPRYILIALTSKCTEQVCLFLIKTAALEQLFSQMCPIIL